MRQSLKGGALRHFTLSLRKSAGRNSSGRITSFHRGGGSKRLQRKIDLKRSTESIGIVERIEYDPNRSSRIALVRWGVKLRRQRKCNTIEEFAPPRKILESTIATIFCLYSFSMCPDNAIRSPLSDLAKRKRIDSKNLISHSRSKESALCPSYCYPWDT